MDSKLLVESLKNSIIEVQEISRKLQLDKKVNELMQIITIKRFRSTKCRDGDALQSY